ARLHGRLLEAEPLLQSPLQPHFLADHKRLLDSSRRALGPEAFNVRVAEGAASSWRSTFARLEAYLADGESAAPVQRVSPFQARGEDCAEGLTEGQLEVVRLLAEGMTNKEIARKLDLSAKTVMHHTVAIYQRLGVRGRSEAVAWAMRAGVAL